MAVIGSVKQWRQRWVRCLIKLAAGVSFATIFGLSGFAGQENAAVKVDVPSGQSLTLHQQLVVQPEERILYLGFLAPAIGGDYPVRFDRASLDMDVVCEAFAIPLAGRLIGQGLRIDEVVVRLMERAIEYGAVDVDAAQFMSFYDISGGSCVWN